MFKKGEAAEEVVVAGFRYTPRGIVYDLVHPDDTLQRYVPYDRIRPINGVTHMVKGNPLSGGETPLEPNGERAKAFENGMANSLGDSEVQEA